MTNHKIQKQTFESIKEYILEVGEGNYSINGIAKFFNCDWRTARKYLALIKDNKTPHANKTSVCFAANEIKKYQNIIEKKLSLSVKVKHIYNFLKKEHNVKFSYQSLTRWVRSFKDYEKHLKGTQSKLVIERLPRWTGSSWLKRRLHTLFQEQCQICF